jgi:hypothetical protein
MDPVTNEALISMLPPGVRLALEGGADPTDLARSLLAERAQATATSRPEIESGREEPWPELGWHEGSPVPAPQVELRPSQEPAVFAPAISALEERLADFARAVGACTLCLGEIPECPVCRGSGRPGWAVPEPAFFEVFVVPALRRLEGEDLRHARVTAARHLRVAPEHQVIGQTTGMQEGK